MRKFGECRAVTGNRSAASATVAQKMLIPLTPLTLSRPLCRYAADVAIARRGYVGINGLEGEQFQSGNQIDLSLTNPNKLSNPLIKFYLS